MTENMSEVLRMTRHFSAPPERVFKAWTEEALAQLWLFTSKESEFNKTDIDARPGGQWQITDRRAGTNYTGSGEYLDVDPPRRLVFTFGMAQFSPNYDVITVELEEEEGGTRMTFIQEGTGIADELKKVPVGEKSGSEEGWNLMFISLASALKK